MTLPASFLKAPIAHRGLHDLADGRAENSLAAMQAAVRHGYGIEIDVQLTRDDHAVVFHDYKLERLTGKGGKVREHALADLSGIQLSGGGGAIPSLPEVLEVIGGRVPLLLEIKDQDGAMGPDVGPLEASVAAAVKGYDGEVAIMSYNPHAVARIAELVPERPRGIVTEAYDPAVWKAPEEALKPLREIEHYDRVGATFISHDVNDLTRQRVLDLKAGGATILCWTVRSPEQERIARQVADNVTFEGYLP